MKCALYGLSSIRLRATKNSRSFHSWQVHPHVRAEFTLRLEQTAVIKEALRIGVPVPAGLPRVVPPSGAIISGVKIPGGVRASWQPVAISYLMSFSRQL
jgi:cytochrome P450